MHVWIDPEACGGCASCVVAAPTVFSYDDNIGKSVVVDPYPAPELHDQVRMAALHCPLMAVHVDESEAQ